MAYLTQTANILGAIQVVQIRMNGWVESQVCWLAPRSRKRVKHAVMDSLAAAFQACIDDVFCPLGRRPPRSVLESALKHVASAQGENQVGEVQGLAWVVEELRLEQRPAARGRDSQVRKWPAIRIVERVVGDQAAIHKAVGFLRPPVREVWRNVDLQQRVRAS